jgi:hypothetical protein
VLGLVQGFWRFKAQPDGFVNGSEQKAAIHNRIGELQNMPIERGMGKTQKKRRELLTDFSNLMKHNRGFQKQEQNRKGYPEAHRDDTVPEKDFSIRQVNTVLRIRDVYPGSRILIFTHPGSRIPDPKTAIKEGGEKKLVVISFFCSHKFYKIENYFIFGMLKKKIWANFQRIIELFPQIIVTKLSKIWVWHPGSEIRDPEKTYSGSRIPGSKRHRIPDPQH